MAACQEGLRVCPDDVELLFLKSILHLEQGDLAGAEADLVLLMSNPPDNHFASVAAGLRGYKAHHNLGVVYRRQGKSAQAEAQWRAALDERPDFLPVRLEQSRHDDVLATADTLESTGYPVESAVVRARVQLARKEFAAARALLDPVIAAHPQAVWPRLILSHVLLQEDRDPDAAERALRAVLELEPQHAQARHNLAVLLQQRHQARDQAFVGAVGLSQFYHLACATPSDINEHLPTLYALARECRHVTELGTRTGVSTTALLYAQPDVLITYDRVRFPQVEQLARLAGRTQFVIHEKDVLWTQIEETDLLFIDTWHVYQQLKEELRLHAGKARKYIVLHDTTTFAQRGEDEGHQGLWPAVEEFLAQGEFRLKARSENNNGLTVLERSKPR
jgi:tetratricopeptide (TPR) repeat protein